jgi:lambda family phage tail tape measure protein
MADDLIKVTLSMESEDVVRTLKNVEKLEKEIVRLQAGYTRLKQFQGTANLTQKQYAIGVAQTDAKIAHLTKTLHSGSAAINKHAEHLVQAKNKMSKFGMISQQVGYQVGDFFVQVQSGQNMLVAFGQQGTQLAGLIPGIGGAIAGVSIAIGTMLVKAFMDAEGEADSFKSALTALEESFSALKDTVTLLEDDKLEEKFGSLTDVVRSLAEATLDLDRALELKNLSQALSKMVSELTDPNLFQRFNMLITSPYLTGDMNQQVENEIRAEKYNKLGAGLDFGAFTQKTTDIMGLAKLGEVEGVVKGIEVLFKEMAAGQPFTDMDNQLLVLLKSFSDLAISTAEVEAMFNGTAKSSTDAASAASTKAKEAIADAVELIRIKKAEADLEKLIYTYGEDSVAARTKNADNAARITKAKWEEKFAADGITDQERTLINLLVEGARLHEQNKDKIADAKDEARELEKALRESATALNSMITFGEGLDKALAVAVAKVKALKADMDETVAGTIAGNLFDAGLKKDKALETTSDPAKIRLITKEYREQVGVAEQLNAVLTEASDIKAAEKAANATEKETPADKLTKEAFALDSKLNKQRAVMGLSGEQLYVEEMRYALIDKIGQEEAKNFTLEIDRVAKILAAKQQLIALDQQRADFADLVADSFADSFMSIVDGTATVKEAFRAMALDIVKHLFKVLVMQQAINAIGGAMSGSSNALVKSLGGGLESYKAANGAAFSGGNVIPFASGGVVGSPTNFAMSGGRTGLMGEAGPEAIMPLKRGPDGKLGVSTTGGSQSITVVQNINVSTGVQQTVRAEVMGLMPQIAAASKAAVLDAKRRGGSFGGSFR